MINVNQITSMLRRLQPDTALQKYAEMHKNDPYVMALAMSEFNRRKQMRQGAQANAPEQPKVVDQAIQSMAAPMPEDVGIGQLPAGDMNFADGGIVAFDGGGKVERYQSGGQPPGPYGGLTGRPLTGKTGYEGMGPGEFFSTIYTQALRKLGLTDKKFALTPAEKRAAQAEANKIAATQGTSYEELYGPARSTVVTTPEFRSAGAAPAAAAPGAAAPAANAGPGTSGPRRNTGTPPPTAPAGAGAGTSTSSLLRAPVVPPESAFKPDYSLFPTSEEARAEMANVRPDPSKVVDPYGEERQNITNMAALLNEQALSAHDREVKARGVLGEKEEARYKARGEKLDKQEKDLGLMSLVEAGFAIMSGESPYALKNIGAGATIGFKSYKQGLDKLDAARDRVDEGLARLEIARRSEGIMNAQQRSALVREGNNMLLKGMESSVNAMDKYWGVAKDDAVRAATAGLNARMERAKTAAQDARTAGEQANALQREAMGQTGANLRQLASNESAQQVARTNASRNAGEAYENNMARLLETVRKNIADEAKEMFPFDPAARSKYQRDQFALAVQKNPSLAKYLGVAGGGGAPSGADIRFDEKTGQFVPLR